MHDLTVVLHFLHKSGYTSERHHFTADHSNFNLTYEIRMTSGSAKFMKEESEGIA